MMKVTDGEVEKAVRLADIDTAILGFLVYPSLALADPTSCFWFTCLKVLPITMSTISLARENLSSSSRNAKNIWNKD